MKISVVMTSYNGEKYIYEQMRSIYEQTIQPDEVIVFDDCSKDNTVTIIEDFIKHHHLKNWKLTVNPKNKGWMKNFIEALKAAHGSYIFFSDQDDIWYNDKIEIMTSFMQKHPEILCLVGKVTTIDKNGTMLKGRSNSFTENNSKSISKHSFSASFNTAIMPGCAMCITKKLADIVIQANVKNFSHDQQCCRLGILLDGTYTLDRPVIHHRLHEHNASNFGPDIQFGSSNLQKRIESIKNNTVWLEKISKIPDMQELLDPEKMCVIRNTILFQKERLKFLSDKNILDYIKLLKCRKYYSGLSMYVGDFCYAFHINKITGKILRYINYSKNARNSKERD